MIMRMIWLRPPLLLSAEADLPRRPEAVATCAGGSGWLRNATDVVSGKILLNLPTPAASCYARTTGATPASIPRHNNLSAQRVGFSYNTGPV